MTASPRPSSARDATDDASVDDPHLIACFAAAMAAAGPFEDAPRLAVGVSGGADSMALAFLAAEWAEAHGGRLLALVVDHGLRPESAGEAALTVSRLTERGVATRLLTVAGLTKGSALAARAREARYHALTDACAECGILHLLLGHHASDQAETMMFRALSGSGRRGLSGMAGVMEIGSLRILRPLLTVPPAWLRTLLTGRGAAWIEDPSNHNPKAARARLRRLRQDPGGEGEGTRSLSDAARYAGLSRSASEASMAAMMASRVIVRPEGFALLPRGPIAPEALAELLRAVAGAPFAPAVDRIAALAACPKPQTIGGVRIVRAGRLGDGWLLVREEAAVAPPVPALDGALWDRRFRLRTTLPLPIGTMLGTLGEAAAQMREHSDLPASALRVMPALWRCNSLVAVPQLLYPDTDACERGCRVVFDPPRPLAGAPFCPA